MRKNSWLLILFLLPFFAFACDYDDGSGKFTAPAEVTAVGENGQVIINWSPVTRASGYNLYWSQTPGITHESGTQVVNVSAPYFHTKLTNGATYYYVVTAMAPDGSNESWLSDEVSATPTE